MTQRRSSDLCPGCLAAKGRANPCPDCGYDEAAERGPLLLPHRTLLNGQFLVGRVLGKPGGFGITYLGWDQNLETRVAIKEFLPRDLAGRGTDRVTIALHSRDEGGLFRFGLEQFLTEARTLAQLDHPNIVRVRHFFEANGTAYLVMDYYQGLSLAEHLERHGGRLPEEQAKQLMLPILDGLRAVHAKGFLHRDIKPQNIYLARLDSGGTRPILLDFGAARLALGERSRSLSVVVSPGYAPFEQYHRKGNQGPWTDIYSAAAVIYRLVTGVTPPEATERRDLDVLKPAAAFGVSRHLSDALGEALALAPEKRPQTVPGFQARLWGIGVPPEPGPAPGPTAPPPPPSPAHPSVPSAAPAPLRVRKTPAHTAPPASAARRRLWPAAFATALVLLGLGGWYQYREGQLRRAADDRAFRAALGADTDAAYRDYLGACAAGDCGHRAQAEQRLSELAAEAARLADAARAAADREARDRAGREGAAREAANRQVAAAREARDRADRDEAQRQAETDRARYPTMVAIPAGSFSMGCQPGEKECEDNERPAHRVQIPAFELGQYEVTFDQWDACAAEFGCTQMPADAGIGRGKHPVILVSWNDAKEYVAWLSHKTGRAYRLPTEAEWEYAARAGSTTAYSTGNCITTEQANYNGNADYADCGAKTGVYLNKTELVGSYPANRWGLHDMHGNVDEWIQDCWHESYKSAPTDASEWRDSCEHSARRTLRGGSWHSAPSKLRSAFRGRIGSDIRSEGIGFRVARTLTP
ncbi:bifunctional serine/threonine-protein kinase/formylglycine-generating enzyme family protein [uncultured Thiodictyon sp.]|jgi:formylglycine-generating enzyme required for sulfatase activity/serine/threonine protein kinase|uniref:bifunctional serine/threonine-protein kinase/formylglycine-generating enzyme family protein n=1 Tax=uncultured Thiodictyon sp. TaxID=1846217 RepID=UPI0025E0F7EA|nr:bifunctional serine/threonine-protein kinase/formylglycine-generating enzyme family protein [uncultured Thiodictyon sp.]